MKSVHVSHPNASFTDGRSKHADHYLVPKGDEPQVGDIVLVQVIVDAHLVSVQAGRVEAVSAYSHPDAVVFYQKLVPVHELVERRDANVERRDANVERREKEYMRARIRDDLNVMLAKASDDIRYGLLASSNPEADRLLTRLRMLSP